ncbi:MAG: polyhydroxyalkanoate synthesis repressor PhaR [Gammaproteobacteria bacterium]|nr:polyhydroxyalkanoate synthesis repressor PhaR [Gammaproteobacteria bacterium]
MADKRIIKKYPNRRLYDTAESKYITLEDVRRLVLEDIPFCVIDKKTGEDITRNILLQIIIEQEDFGEPIFTTDALHKLIGFYGNSVQNLASDFFERSMGLLAEQQNLMQGQIDKAVGGTPMTSFAELAQRNMAMWRKMQEDFLRAAGMASGQAGKAGKPNDGTSGGTGG